MLVDADVVSVFVVVSEFGVCLVAPNVGSPPLAPIPCVQLLRRRIAPSMLVAVDVVAAAAAATAAAAVQRQQ